MISKFPAATVIHNASVRSSVQGYEPSNSSDQLSEP